MIQKTPTLPRNLKAHVALPVHIVHLVLKEAGLEDRVSYRSALNESRLFSELVDLKPVEVGGHEHWQITLRSGGILTVLPEYFRKWAADVDARNKGQQIDYSLTEFFSILDHWFFVDLFDTRNYCLEDTVNPHLSTRLEQVILTLAGVRRSDWSPGEIKNWLALAPLMLRTAEPQTLMGAALRRFLGDGLSTAGLKIKRDGVRTRERLPDSARAVLGRSSRLGQNAYLGQVVTTVGRAVGVVLRDLNLNQYLALLAPDEIDCTGWDEQFDSQPDVSTSRALLEKVVQTLMPLPNHYVIEVALSSTEYCSELGYSRLSHAAILGHTAILN